jgi:hypothetical protein
MSGNEAIESGSPPARGFPLPVHLDPHVVARLNVVAGVKDPETLLDALRVIRHLREHFAQRLSDLTTERNADHDLIHKLRRENMDLRDALRAQIDHNTSEATSRNESEERLKRVHDELMALKTALSKALKSTNGLQVFARLQALYDYVEGVCQIMEEMAKQQK